MASKKLKPQNELSGTRLGDPDMGLKAKWGGSAMGPDTIAAVSKMDRSKPGAPLRAGCQPMSKSMSMGGPEERKGYGAANAS